MLKTEQIGRVVAPYIIGNDTIKKLLFLQLFTIPEFKDEKVNMLLIGDSSSGKSDISYEVTQISNNAIYLSRESTVAGLVGADNKGVLVGGVIHEAENGVIVMDELDKADSKLRKVLLQIMDSYEFNMPKSGINHSISIKCNIVATANPMADNWQSGGPNIYEIPFKPTLKNRFHIMAPFESLNISDYDKLKESFKQRKDKLKREQEREKIREYVALAREKNRYVHIPDRIIDLTVDYLKFLKRNHNHDLPNVTPRLIPGLLALMKASARMDISRSTLDGKISVNEDDFYDIKALMDDIIKQWRGRYY